MHICWIIFLTLSLVLYCDFDAVLSLFPCPDPEGDVVSLQRDLIQKLSFLFPFFVLVSCKIIVKVAPLRLKYAYAIQSKNFQPKASGAQIIYF